LVDLEELQLPAAPSVESDNFDVYQNYELQADESTPELSALLTMERNFTILKIVFSDPDLSSKWPPSADIVLT
jgi:hypothetical protein